MRQGGELQHDQNLLGVLTLRRTTLCEWPTGFFGTNKRIIPKPVSSRFYTEIDWTSELIFDSRPAGFRAQFQVNALAFKSS
jgi:hypothetical protein